MALFHYCLVIKSLLLFHLFRISLSNDTVSASNSLKDGDLLVSNRGTYALGFFSPGNSGFRYLGIWYYQVTGQTVVWVANRNSPINGASGILSVSNEGNLVLYPDNRTASPVWSTNVSVSGSKSCVAQLLDSGNFVLVQNDSSRTLMWQSFDHPANTWLPFMVLGLDLKTGLNRFLTSWKSADDPATGNYTYRIDPTGFPQLSLYKGPAKFWRTGSWTGQRWSGVPKMTHNYIFNISFVNDDSEVSIVDGVTDPKILTRMTLNEFGIQQRFTWSPTQHTWFEFWSAPKEQCDYYSHCGPNGYCKPDESQNFECECLPGFKPKSPQEWLLRDGSGGCVRNYRVSTCQSGEGFVKVERVKVPDTSVTRVHMSLGLKQCEQECLRNCSCMAYASAYAETNGGVGSGCLTWHGDLVDTRTYYTGAGQNLYVRVDAIELARHRKKGPFRKKGILAAIIVSAIAICFVATASLCFLWQRKERGGKNSASFIASSSFLEPSFSGNEPEENKADIPLFDFSSIAIATEHFSSNNKLGQGGFGPVYKGVLSNGKEIAVKRLSKYSGQGKEEFKNEVTLIAKLQHRNLVKTLGCCIQGEEKMLIYEYLPNKSLDSFIFDERKKSLLDWEKRMDIALGIARGILYLHQDSRLRIIHRDLKASNVLLDETLNPKISDFGMARIFKGNQLEANTNRVVGTYGYMSPEYAMQGLFSIKSDVYSFGVLLLEIITARRNSGHYPDSPTSNLVGHVWDLWRKGKALEIVDPSLGESYPTNQVERCIQIGLLCVQEHATDRPTMSNIVFMLENGFSIATPKQPAFVMKTSFYYEDHIGSSTEEGSSSNNVSITMVYGR